MRNVKILLRPGCRSRDGRSRAGRTAEDGAAPPRRVRSRGIVSDGTIPCDTPRHDLKGKGR